MTRESSPATTRSPPSHVEPANRADRSGLDERDLRSALHRPEVVRPIAWRLCELTNELEAVAPELRDATRVRCVVYRETATPRGAGAAKSSSCSAQTATR